MRAKVISGIGTSRKKYAKQSKSGLGGEADLIAARCDCRF